MFRYLTYYLNHHCLGKCVRRLRRLQRSAGHLSFKERDLEKGAWGRERVGREGYVSVLNE